MRLKAQSAIEYLVTYGWMLLVVAITGATVYNLAGSECFETSGFSNTPIQVQDFGADGDTGNLTLILANSGANSAEINSVSLISDNGEAETQAENLEISPADTEPFTLSQTLTPSNNCNNYDLNIDYNTGGLENIQASGTISTSLEVASVPGSPEIDTVEQ